MDLRICTGEDQIRNNAVLKSVGELQTVDTEIREVRSRSTSRIIRYFDFIVPWNSLN